MYDELTGNLRAQATHFSVHDETSLLLLKAADAIEELQQITTHYEEESKGWWLAACDAKEERERLKEQIPKWIPVTERLPNNQCNVLCDDDGRVVVGYYTDEEVGWHDMHSYKIYPTHWMPLPKPPESEKE